MQIHTINCSPDKKYHIGLDLLKIIAMFMVTTLHTLGHGGIVWNENLSGINYDIAWLLEIMSFCAVNCYAMISGYVGIDSKIKYYKLIYFWLQIAFSGLFITFLFSIYHPEWININNWKDATFPIYRKVYWYMTAYFGLFLLLPIINSGINALLPQQRKLAFYTIVFFLIILPFFSGQDLFLSMNGYSLIWLLFCYILGALLAKESLFIMQSKVVLFFIYLFCVLLTAYLKKYQNIDWVNYSSPTILFCGISLVVLFSKVEFKKLWLIKSIKYIAGLTLGIYIFHEHPLVRTFYIRGKALDYFNLEPMSFILAILGMASTIFLSGLIFDACRKWIFDKFGIVEKLAKVPYLS